MPWGLVSADVARMEGNCKEGGRTIAVGGAKNDFDVVSASEVTDGGTSNIVGWEDDIPETIYGKFPNFRKHFYCNY